MTRRSILAGTAPNVIIKAGGSVTVKGHESDRVSAENTGTEGLKVEGRSQSEVARARAAVGEHVLFDLRFKLPGWEGKNAASNVIEVQFGGDGEVFVPTGSNVKVYAGKDIDVQDIRGQVDAYSGYRLNLRAVQSLGHASAGWTMALDCRTLAGEKVEFKAGSDIRFHIHDLTNAHLHVKDLGGYWEARIGDGEKSIYIISRGGDATIVTDQVVEPLPPNYVLGNIESPNSLTSVH